MSFLSLPEAEQNSVVTGPQNGSQIPSTTDVVQQVYSAEISENGYVQFVLFTKLIVRARKNARHVLF